MSLRLTLIGLAAIGAVVLGLLGVSAVRGASVSVAAVNFEFQPPSRTVLVGDTVVWTMSGDPHTVRSGTIDANNVGHPSDGPLDSGTKGPGDSYSRTFTTAGTYRYFCEIHADSQMKGTIEVLAAATTPTPTPKPTPRPTPTSTPRSTPARTSTPTPMPSPTTAVIVSPTPGPTTPPVAAVTPEPTLSPSSPPAATPSPGTENGTKPTADATPFLVVGTLMVIGILGAALLFARRNA